MSADIFADLSGPELPMDPGVQPLQPKPFWPIVILLGIVFLFVLGMRGCGGGGDDDAIVDVKGLHVLIVEDVQERDKLTRDQLAIFNSIELREWYDANCAEDGYRNYDVDDMLDNEPEVWKRMREGLTLKPPAVVIANDRKGSQMQLPASPEALMRELNKFKRRR